MMNKVSKRCPIEKKGTPKFKVPKVDFRSTDENEIEWISNETDFIVWFPPERNPLETSQLRKARTFKSKIIPNFPPDRYEYTIFCYGGNEMAEGQSSPEMIIQ